MLNKVVIGIDTSNYTTSCAVCSLDGRILESYKQLLPVKEGENGLRQSDAVFAHVKNFQIISSQIKEKHAEYEIVAVGYSAYPRDVVDSYMPCFLVGKAVAQMISALYNIPAYQFSHQAGHIRAAMYSSGFDTDGDFVAFHVSGGTTEILLASKSDKTGYNVEIIGGSADLHAGQAIDRIGVKMGLKFPCGRELEQLSLANQEKIPSPKISVSGTYCNMSGLENLATKLYIESGNKSLVSAYVLEFLSKTIEKLTVNVREQYGDIPVIYAGGVMSNSVIKAHLTSKLANIYFSAPEFSSDNAAGVALLACEAHLKS